MVSEKEANGKLTPQMQVNIGQYRNYDRYEIHRFKEVGNATSNTAAKAEVKRSPLKTKAAASKKVLSGLESHRFKEKRAAKKSHK